MKRMRWAGLVFLLEGVLAGSLWAEPAPAPQSSASSETDEFPATAALDGDFQTRWSSGFKDDEWWQIDFAEPCVLSGLVLHWEEAFGEKYRIEVSDEGTTWRAVFEEERGDGGSDLIYFEPVTSRFVRVHGVQRATGWGFSLWEVSFRGPESQPTFTADTALSDYPPERALDGRLDTGWRSEPQPQAVFMVQFPEPISLGGLQLNWGADYARTFTVYGWTTNNIRMPLHHREYGNGECDYILFDEVRISRLEFQLREGSRDNGFEIREILLKGVDEKATPLRKLMGRALDSQKSWFPLWLSREQEFWTITGVPGGAQKSLLSETGTIEPQKKAFTVMPFLYDGQKLVSWDQAEVTQELEEGYLPLPRVVWNHPDWGLEIKPVTFGEPDRLLTLVRYRISNKKRTTQNLRFGLTVLPVQLNPAWQHGGLSPIKQARWDRPKQGATLAVEDRVRMLLETRPVQSAVLPFEEGDAARLLSLGLLPDRREAKDPKGLLSAACLYGLSIPPEESRDIYVLFPLGRSAVEEWPWENTAAEFEHQLELARAFWKPALNRARLDIPEPRLAQLMQSNLAFILLEQDGPWLKPGTRFYNSSWLRDGALMGLTLLQLGHGEPVKRYEEAVEDLIRSDGWIPWMVNENGKPVSFNPDSGEGHEYDAQGQYTFLVRNLYDYTRDEAWLGKRYSAVRKTLEFGLQLRRQRMTPDYEGGPFYGLLPASNSHEGYFPAQHSYWDDFWLLRGLEDGIYLAYKLGRTEDAQAWRAEAEKFQRDVAASLDKVIARDRLDYIPGCVEKGDFDSTSTAIAYTVGDGKAWLPEPYAERTFDLYYDGFVRRLIPGGRSSYTPYEARSAHALVRRGEPRKALNILRFLAADAVHPENWNGMAEVVHVRPRVPAYIGDMPHGWVGSEFISAMRTLFAYEADGRLVLGAGLDADWWRQGLRVSDLPTSFGTVGYNILPEANAMEITVEGQAQPPGGFVWPVPDRFRQAGFELNGQPVVSVDRSLMFTGLPTVIRITLPKALP